MNQVLNLELPAEVLTAARMSLEEVRVELAITLFRLERLSVGRAAELARMPLGDFLTVLAARKIGPHMDADEAMRDAAMLADLPSPHDRHCGCHPSDSAEPCEPARSLEGCLWRGHGA